MELMALSGISLLYEQLAPKGQVSVFSMVSKVTFSYLPGLGEEVIGTAKLERQRNGFNSFSNRCQKLVGAPCSKPK